MKWSIKSEMEPPQIIRLTPASAIDLTIFSACYSSDLL